MSSTRSCSWWGRILAESDKIAGDGQVPQGGFPATELVHAVAISTARQIAGMLRNMIKFHELANAAVEYGDDESAKITYNVIEARMGDLCTALRVRSSRIPATARRSGAHAQRLETTSRARSDSSRTSSDEASPTKRARRDCDIHSFPSRARGTRFREWGGWVTRGPIRRWVRVNGGLGAAR